MYDKTFPSRLKEARSKTGLTQHEVAKELGMARSTLANYEIGRTEPNIKTLKTFAEFFNVSLDWLIDVNLEDNKQF